MSSASEAASPTNPPPLSVERFNHAALNTSDVAKSVDFYTRVLGFYEVTRPNFSFDGSWLYCDGLGMMLHLIHHKSFVPGTATDLGTRSHHLAFRVSDYELARSQLVEHGIAFEERVLPDHGYRQIFFRDPDQNVLELGEWPNVEKMVH